MPLTVFQQELLAVLAPSRSPDSYLAGGSAIHFEPNSDRYSQLDFFHHSEERFRTEEFARLDVTEPLDPVVIKEEWLGALTEAQTFVVARPAEEIGCLYYSMSERRFVAPAPAEDLNLRRIVPHFGRPGGVLPEAGG
jgi:hypothetical protein